MLSSRFKPVVVGVITPLAKGALALGLTPNVVTIIGTTGAVASAFIFYPQGQLLIGTLVITLFILSDLFDGTMARISGTGGTTWGGFLDSTLDRITDAALLIALALYAEGERRYLLLPILLSLLVGFLVPYIRAKAEALGIACSVGIAERTERLIILLLGIGLDGVGVPGILAGSLWLLVVLGTITTVQRALVVRRAH